MAPASQGGGNAVDMTVQSRHRTNRAGSETCSSTDAQQRPSPKARMQAGSEICGAVARSPCAFYRVRHVGPTQVTALHFQNRERWRVVHFLHRWHISAAR